MLLLLATSIALGTLPASGELTFAQALELAELQSPELRSERLAVLASEAGVQVASALPNPTANFRTGRGDPQTTASVELRLPFLVGHTQSAIASARAEADAAHARLRWTRLKTRAAVRRAYFALAEAQAQLALSRRLVELSRELAVMAREQFRVGSAPRLDLEQAALAAERAARDADDQEAAVQLASASLAVLLGLPPTPQVLAADPLELPSPSTFDLAVTARSHPEAQLARENQRGAEARAHEARVARIPVPAAGLDLEGRLSPGVVATAVRGGLTIDLPLLSWNGGAVRQAELTERQREAERLAVEQRLGIALASARRRLELAGERARFYQLTLVPQSRRVEELARLAHAEGKTPLLNVLQAQQELARNEGEALKALRQAQAALADLEEAIVAGP